MINGKDAIRVLKNKDQIVEAADVKKELAEDLKKYKLICHKIHEI